MTDLVHRRDAEGAEKNQKETAKAQRTQRKLMNAKRFLWERRLAAIRAGGGAPTGLCQNLTNGELRKHYLTLRPLRLCGEIVFVFSAPSR
jgi:hypothetical protein